MLKPLNIFVPHCSDLLTDHLPHGDGLIAHGFMTSLARRGHRLQVAAERAELSQPLHRNIALHVIPLQRTKGVRSRLEYMLRMRRLFNQLKTTAHFDLIHQLNPVFTGVSLALAGCRLPLVLGTYVARWPEGADLEGADPEAADPEGADAEGLCARGSWADGFIGRSRNLIACLQQRRADALLLTTPAAWNRLPDAEAARSRIHVLPHGIDCELFSPRPGWDSPQGLQADRQRPSILFLANILRRKGIFTLLEAFPAVAREFPDCSLQIAGSGPDLAEVERRVSRLGCARQVELLGQQEREHTPALYRGCSIYCLPSFGEPYGTTVVEAMSCARSLVVTDCGALPHLVHDRGGLKVPAGNPEALARALIGLLRSPNRRVEMGRYNRRLVESKMSWDSVSQQLEDIYELTLARRALSSPRHGRLGELEARGGLAWAHQPDFTGRTHTKVDELKINELQVNELINELESSELKSNELKSNELKSNELKTNGLESNETAGEAKSRTGGGTMRGRTTNHAGKNHPGKDHAMRSRARGGFNRIRAGMDGIFVLALALASAIYGNITRLPAGSVRQFLQLRVTVLNVIFATLFVLAWISCCTTLGLYRLERRSAFPTLRRAAKACAVMAAGFGLYLLLAKTAGPTLRIVLVFFAVSLAFEILRLAGERLIHLWIAGRDPRIVVIAGTGRKAGMAWRQIRTRHHSTVTLLGFVDDRAIADMAPDIADRYLGTMDQLSDILLRHVVDELLIALPTRSCYDSIQRAIGIAEQVGVEVVYMQDLYVTTLRKRGVEAREMFTELAPSQDGLQVTLAIKRMLDMAGAAAGLLLVSPLFLLVALVIRSTSQGPIFFVQQRYGYRRRKFPMYKFRSMVANAPELMAHLEDQNEAVGPIFKIRRDPRITPVGRILRTTSIDELPQLWNVLMGDMSLVGPRPMSIRDVLRFSDAALMRRFSVKPGITGLWQVSGRSDASFARWIQLDFSYIDHWSLALDFRILARTVSVVLKRSGAA